MQNSSREAYNEALEDLFRLWRQKSLPLDARRQVIGAADAAARAQGDTLLTEKELQDAVLGKHWHPEEEMEIIRRVRKYVFEDKKLRPQYVYLIRRILIRYLNVNYAQPIIRENAQSN